MKIKRIRSVLTAMLVLGAMGDISLAFAQATADQQQALIKCPYAGTGFERDLVLYSAVRDPKSSGRYNPVADGRGLLVTVGGKDFKELKGAPDRLEFKSVTFSSGRDTPDSQFELSGSAGTVRIQSKYRPSCVPGRTQDIQATVLFNLKANGKTVSFSRNNVSCKINADPPEAMAVACVGKSAAPVRAGAPSKKGE